MLHVLLCCHSPARFSCAGTSSPWTNWRFGLEKGSELPRHLPAAIGILEKHWSSRAGRLRPVSCTYISRKWRAEYVVVFPEYFYADLRS